MPIGEVLPEIVVLASAIVALLAGHRPDVQSEHYLTLPVDANQAPDLETAMGVTDILRKALEEAVKNREKT